MHCALPMYDWPESASRWDDWYREFKLALPPALQRELSDGLQRDAALATDWLHPSMLLGQSCGYPYVQGLRGKVLLHGSFDFGLPDTPPGDYHSVIVSRPDGPASLADAGGATVAYNSANSMSGAVLLFANWRRSNAAAPAALVESGAHRASVEAVVEGRADVACIDAVSWRLARHYVPGAAELIEIDRSAPVPGLPLITSLPLHAQQHDIASAIVAACNTQAAARLGILAWVPQPDKAYDRIAAQADLAAPLMRQLGLLR